MKLTCLETTECLQWLQDVHKIPALEYSCAIITGNEDAPDKVELYARNHMNCKPAVYNSNDDGNLILTKEGEKPDPKHIVDRPATPADVKE